MGCIAPFVRIGNKSEYWRNASGSDTTYI